ncbi:hypothetical protein Ddc_00091 [Ditylenchus destructor]|nr:hypothetical protein Ddc_00091 [Ditylenchus destructor]
MVISIFSIIFVLGFPQELVGEDDSFVTPNCDFGWEQRPSEDGSTACYKFFDDEQAYHIAQLKCQRSVSHPSNLTSFHSKEEFDFLVKLLIVTKKNQSWIGMRHYATRLMPEGEKNQFELFFEDETEMFDFHGMNDTKYGEYWGSGHNNEWEPNG